jgi:hypothetical protein
LAIWIAGLLVASVITIFAEIYAVDRFIDARDADDIPLDPDVADPSREPGRAGGLSRAS